METNKMATKIDTTSVRMTKETHRNLAKIRKELNLTISETIDELITAYRESQNLKQQLEDTQNTVAMGEISYTLLGLDGEQITTVQDAENNSGQDLKTIVRYGTLQRAKYLNSTMGKKDFESMSEDELKATTTKGSAYHRITQAIEFIKNHNDNQSEKKLKFYISSSLVFKITGSNRRSINQFFKQYQTMIDEHNNKHQLTDMDNRKGKGFDPKIVLGIE
jgi:ketosteroid isomerase-like protein